VIDMVSKVKCADCLTFLKTLPDNCVDAVVTDPPAGIGFMGREWDTFNDVPSGFVGASPANIRATNAMFSHKGQTIAESGKARHAFIEFITAVMSECLRVLKPGGHALVWALPRTSHWTGTAIEDAGFEVRDRISHVFGCLSDDTEIMVDGRWEPYRNVAESRLALGYNPDDGTFTWQPIERVFAYDHDDTAYRIESDRTNQIVTRNHRCLVERGPGSYGFQVAEEAARKLEISVPILEDVRSLLESLPMPNARLGEAEQDVWDGMRCRINEQEEDRQVSPAKSALPVLQDDVSTGSSGEGFGGLSLLLNKVRSTGSQVETGIFCKDEEDWRTGTRGLDRGFPQVLSFKDGWVTQPGVEGWHHDTQNARELCWCPIRPLPGSVLADGPEGRIRDGASTVCCEGNGSMSVEGRGCASRQPRPDGQCDQESGTVRAQSGPQAFRAPRHTVTDLARITPFHFKGVVWCVKVATGAFVARRNGKVFVTGNSGFPKSLDVSKAIDEAAGAERVILSEGKSLKRMIPGADQDKTGSWIKDNGREFVPTKTAPATDAARQWDGWGTALKPAMEDWWLARKPLIGTVVANVVKHGTGALNIDGCRVNPGELTPGGRNGKAHNRGGWCARETFGVRPIVKPHADGRWPAHLVHDGSEEVLAGFPDSDGQVGDVKGNEPSHTGDGNSNCYGEYGRVPQPKRGDTGSAARFFYCSKASKRDRGENNHPTVKNTRLMRWLCRLVTPPGGVVLDPFAGSGSTGVACAKEGFLFIGCEKDATHARIASKRFAEAVKEAERRRIAKKARQAAKWKPVRFKPATAARKSVDTVSKVARAKH